MKKSKILNINPKAFILLQSVSSLIYKPKNYFKINKVKNLEHITNIFLIKEER